MCRHLSWKPNSDEAKSYKIQIGRKIRIRVKCAHSCSCLDEFLHFSCSFAFFASSFQLYAFLQLFWFFVFSFHRRMLLLLFFGHTLSHTVDFDSIQLYTNYLCTQHRIFFFGFCVFDNFQMINEEVHERSMVTYIIIMRKNCF